jgi:hypothetical protein
MPVYSLWPRELVPTRLLLDIIVEHPNQEASQVAAATLKKGKPH